MDWSSFVWGFAAGWGSCVIIPLAVLGLIAWKERRRDRRRFSRHIVRRTDA